MSYKAFCDKCGKETQRNYVSDRFAFTVGEYTFRIIVATDHTWNSGVICLKCLRDAMNKQLAQEAKSP